jgi:hypothetical protein
MQAIEKNIQETTAILPLLLNGSFEQAMLKLHTKKAN